jgi:predicted RecA/RadA family phage recombinase
MKNRIHDAGESHVWTFTNASGVAKTAGTVVAIGALLAMLQVDVAAANGSQSAAQVGGVFEVTKQSADVMAQGQIVGYDIANQRADSTFIGNLEVFEAAGSGKTTVLLRFPNVAVPLRKKYTASADDNTNNFAIINTGLGATPTGPVLVLIQTAAGVYRVPQGVVEWLTGADLGKLKIADSGLAAGEFIHVFVGIA